MSNFERGKRNGTFNVDKGKGTKEYYRKRELEDGYISDDGTIIESRELGDGFIVHPKHGKTETFQKNTYNNEYTGNRGSKIKSTGKNKYEYKPSQKSQVERTTYAQNSISYSDNSSGKSFFDIISNAIGSFIGVMLLVGIGLIIVGEIFQAIFKGAGKVLQVVWPFLLLAVVIIVVIFVIKNRKKTAKGTHNEQQLTTHRKAKSNNTAERTRSVQTILDNKCCICGEELTNGYAVLFTKTNGVEARIDEKCHQAIETLARSEDVDAIESSIQYISGFMGRIDQDVEKKVKGYIDSAESYINGADY